MDYHKPGCSLCKTIMVKFDKKLINDRSIMLIMVFVGNRIEICFIHKSSSGKRISLGAFNFFLTVYIRL